MLDALSQEPTLIAGCLTVWAWFWVLLIPADGGMRCSGGFFEALIAVPVTALIWGARAAAAAWLGI